MEVKDNGISNPLIILSREEVLAWLRERADLAGYTDRELSAVQITVEHPFMDGQTFHYEAPSLVVMVSNIKDSRR